MEDANAKDMERVNIERHNRPGRLILKAIMKGGRRWGHNAPTWLCRRMHAKTCTNMRQ
jgi:hypothetical protein